MWIIRKPSLKEPVPSQNAQPTANPLFRVAPSTPSALPAQVEKIATTITQYTPLSDLITIPSILASPNHVLKKFRESVFLGEIVEGKRNGKGLMIYVNGRVYQGQWCDNFKQGKGYQKFSNGSLYKGDYVKGKPQGCGRYQWDNGQVYEGQWLNGLKHGSGIWRGAKGDSYIGQWSEGRADGYGVHTWVNGDRYEGQFKDCLKHGQGVEHFSNGDSYKGNYQNGKPSGYGEYYWASGCFFKGNFKGGLRYGQGVWKKSMGRSDKYEGQWVADKKQGYGVFSWADGSVYKGNFVNDLKEGSGQIQYIDGSIFRGQWHADRPIEQPQPMNFQHQEQDCELLMPTSLKGQGINQHFHQNQPIYVEQLPQHPLYLQPQRPVLKSTSKNIRPRNFTRNTTRNQIRSRGESQNGRRHGLVKKMSAGTVRGKSELSKQHSSAAYNNPKSMSSSFFLYKIHGQESKKQGIGMRQTRTSAGCRSRPNNIEQQLKYFARSKINSFSELH